MLLLSNVTALPGFSIFPGLVEREALAGWPGAGLRPCPQPSQNVRIPPWIRIGSKASSRALDTVSKAPWQGLDPRHNLAAHMQGQRALKWPCKGGKLPKCHIVPQMCAKSANFFSKHFVDATWGAEVSNTNINPVLFQNATSPMENPMQP